MKKVFMVLALACTSIAFGQTAQEHFDNGVAKHNKHDLKGAIKDYDKAIKRDKTHSLAYFNRGLCELQMKDYKAAMSDFDKTIELNPTYADAYYSRASVFASQEKYMEALPDLDKTIELNPATPNALTLRGQIRAQSGNKTGACEDFNLAKQLGDRNATMYLSEFCGNEQQAGESFMLYWPENENWKLGSNNEDATMAMMELIHTNETIENWTEMGTMMSIKGAINAPLEKVMNKMLEQMPKQTTEPKLTFIEKDETAEYPCIIFTIENVRAPKSKVSESAIWYIVQGKTSLYINFYTVKQAALSEAAKSKWIAFFKSGKIVNK